MYHLMVPHDMRYLVRMNVKAIYLIDAEKWDVEVSLSRLYRLSGIERFESECFSFSLVKVYWSYYQ